MIKNDDEDGEDDEDDEGDRVNCDKHNGEESVDDISTVSINSQTISVACFSYFDAAVDDVNNM